MEIKIGADPEFFLRRHGELVSAHGMVPGTKEKPYQVDGGAIQVDGMALEFNINPATSAEEFWDNIQTVLGGFREFLPENEGWEFDFSPVAEFGKELIEAQPFEARTLGCQPDYNAYTKMENPKPDVNVPFRTASGHIHIGWTEDEDPLNPEHFEAGCMLTEQFDYTILPIMRFFDLDTKRRELYGAPGAFRPKPYGMEYRVLSNHWLKEERYATLVFDTCKWATDKLLTGESYKNTWTPASEYLGESSGNLYSAWDAAYRVMENRRLYGTNIYEEMAKSYELLRTAALEKEQEFRTKNYANLEKVFFEHAGNPGAQGWARLAVQGNQAAFIAEDDNVPMDPEEWDAPPPMPWRPARAPLAGF